MSAISSVQSSAVRLLQQANRTRDAVGVMRDASGASLVATANGVDAPGDDHGAGTTRRANAKVAEALFRPNAPSAMEMKLHLMTRLGEAFGIKLEDHATHASFGRAIQAEINTIKTKPKGALIRSVIERELGFDKLGFSPDTFVSAIIDPNGSDARTVDAALKEHLGLDEGGDDKADAARAARDALRIDDSGLYGFVHN